MKRNITILSFFLLFFSVLSAQFTSDDIRFWIGEGDSECYLVIDFRDDTTDPSFAWGFRFHEGEDFTVADILEVLAVEEPVFSYRLTGGFLNDILYNSHAGLDGEPDWWSTWSGGSSTSMTMNSGISERVQHGRWYGFSYGFMQGTQHPTITYPAYHSQWFTVEEFDYSLGEGENYAVIVVDFVTENGTDPASVAWKIKFDEEISFQEALLLIADNDSEFSIDFDGEEISFLRYQNQEGTSWFLYEGTNMSDWKPAESNFLQNESWLGLAKGEAYTRRPFIPVAAEENPLTTEDFFSSDLRVFPNPVSEYLVVQTEKKSGVELYDISGRRLLKRDLNSDGLLDFSEFRSGVYFLKIRTGEKSVTKRIIKN